LAFAGGEGNPRGLAEWDLAARGSVRTWPYPAGGQVPATAVSSDGHWCLTSWNTTPFSTRMSDKGPVQLIDLTNGRAMILAGAVLWWTDTAGFSAANGVLTVPWHRNTTAWRLSTPAEPIASPTSALCAAYSPDGRRLVLGNTSSEVISVRDSLSGESVLSLTARQTSFMNVGFSPDNNTLFARTQFGELHLWTAPSWDDIAAVEASYLAWIKH
jgi:WD40 repeat protein